jgi:GT2 family glycosyltransferase
MRYSIVIPTYNHCDDLLKPCVESLLKYSYVSDIELIISANGCVDNTREYLTELREKFDYLGLYDNLKIVWNDKPLGYSRATNAGIEVATTDNIVLCNNDVVFFDQYKNAWLHLFERQFIINPKCGISCVIKSISAPAGRDFAIFFLVMIHRKVFDKIGLLNTDYGVGGGEDTEFCIEAENAGFEVCLANDLQFSNQDQIYVGNFPVYHKGEGTMHDKELVPEWDRIFRENSSINLVV